MATTATSWMLVRALAIVIFVTIPLKVGEMAIAVLVGVRNLVLLSPPHHPCSCGRGRDVMDISI